MEETTEEKTKNWVEILVYIMVQQGVINSFSFNEQEKRFENSTLQRENFVITRTGSCMSMLNAIHFLSLRREEEEQLQEFLDILVQTEKVVNSPFSIHLGPFCRPDLRTLEMLLEKLNNNENGRHFSVEKESFNLMILSKTDWEKKTVKNNLDVGLEIKVVQSIDELHEWTKTMTTSFGTNISDELVAKRLYTIYETTHQLSQPNNILEGLNYRRYIGRIGGYEEAVTCGSFVKLNPDILSSYVALPTNLRTQLSGKEVYGIFALGTVPTFTTRGYASQLFQKILKDIFDLGGTHVGLHASSDGCKLYEKFGFRSVGHYSVYFH